MVDNSDPVVDFVSVDKLPYAKELKTCLPYAESKLRESITQAIGAGSACWGNLSGAGVFESDRAKKIAEDLIDEVIELTSLGQPSLGCATTRELVDELKARFESGGYHPDYRTVTTDGEPR